MSSLTTPNDVPGWPGYFYGLAVRERGELLVPVIRKSDHREMCVVMGSAWTGEDGIHRSASYALGTIVSEEAEPGGELVARVRAILAGGVAHLRDDDPLWNDAVEVVSILRRMGMVDGGDAPRLRTLGWQALVALATCAEREARDAAS